MLQRRLGLYLSCLSSALDARAVAGLHVSQAMRLGDTAVNSANHTERHNDGLHAVFAAARAVTSAEAPVGSLALCDRGDGSAAGKQSARLAHAHINATHVPDFVRFAARPHCYEWKCVTPFLTSAQSLGRGSRAHGGSASTSDGGRFAMGNTEEALAVKTLGITHTRGSFVRRRTDRSRASPAQDGSPPPLLTTTSMRSGAATASPSWCRRCSAACHPPRSSFCAP
jgi:hypothetical protein